MPMPPRSDDVHTYTFPETVAKLSVSLDAPTKN